MIIGFDLGTHLCGWCAGDGVEVPIAGAFRLINRDAPGRLGVEFKDHVLALHRRFGAERWSIEAPFLKSHDVFSTLYLLYGLPFLAQTLGEGLGVETELIDQDEVKLGWGGRIRHPRGTKSHERQRLNKEASVHVAETCGIVLPSTRASGRWDAADAAGVWKAGLGRSRSPEFNHWDERASRARGGLL